MRKRFGILLYVGAGAVAVACNAVLGLEEKKLGSNDDGSGANSATGGSSGSGASGGTAGANAGGEGGEAAGDCTRGDEQSCRTVYPILLGNCSRGTVRCSASGTWGPCSIEPDDADSCDDEGDDADCDGTPNGGCPCLSGDTRPCGPETEDGICAFGTSTCVNEAWATCEGAVLPGPRNCQSSDDNDCDGEPDDTRDDECPCASGGTHQCVGDAPADWSGPVGVATAAATSSAPSCTASGYEARVLSLFGEIDEGDAACACACDTPANMTCGTSVGIHHHPSTSLVNCALVAPTGDPVDYTVGTDACTAVLPTGTFRPQRPTLQGGACTPRPTADLETAAWTRRMVACETDESSPAGCAAAELCVPELVSPLEAFCIHRVGTHACPSGPYSERTVYYEDFSDDRACTACTCGALTGTCEGSVTFRQGATCPGPLLSVNLIAYVEYGACVVIDGTHSSPRAAPSDITPQGECPPSGGTLQGSVALEGAVTVCCMP